MTGYIKFSYSYITCGRAPIVAKYNPLWGGGDFYDTYEEPGSPTYSIAPANKYYCNREAAEADGTRANPLTESIR